ncbi:MAG: 3-hydroxy-3-methylglutaryl coenzyme A synthase [Phylliscum demangeonii]|nr:MAG: 3-hydroxy-3-methylglutaryl coenzyme A synthase [Phylliscum demangeonii]
MASRPQNIGIKAIELYFPNLCVDQAELEKFDGVSAGKYTVGLGQTKMSFYIYSFALTTVSALLRKYSIDPTSIGRLEVGTETILDKSKSVKSVLMQLFSPSGNDNIEGVDTVNACYGGTNALFNAVNWVESSAWDGRDAIVVAGDIALYQKGNARPTGGAGCVAMLIGPDAAIVLEPGLRGTYMQHAYDFYKPDLTSEYPVVDGPFSIRCYTQALDACYQGYNRREQQQQQGREPAAPLPKERHGTNGVREDTTHASAPPEDDPNRTPLDRFDHVCFHAPTCKLVAKSYARLLYNDYRAHASAAAFRQPGSSATPASIEHLTPEQSLTDKTVEKTFLGLTKQRFADRVQPSMQVPTQCGNMYCASVWGGLASLIHHVTPDRLLGRRIAVFSYGSGLASSFFSFRVRGDPGPMRDVLDLERRLAARMVVAPAVYDEMCQLREQAHLKKDFTPKGDPARIVPGTYYLTHVDHLFRRAYEVKA